MQTAWCLLTILWIPLAAATCITSTTVQCPLGQVTLSCNTGTGVLTPVPEPAFCGTLLPAFSCIGTLSPALLCQYDASCDHPGFPINSGAPQLTASSSTTKTIRCFGTDFTLHYSYNSSTKSCSYSLDNVADHQDDARVIFRIPHLAANQLWSLQGVQSNLHGNLLTGTDDICLALKVMASASPNIFQCLAPFYNEIGSFCQLAPIMRFQCNQYNIKCSLDNTMTAYTCINEGSADTLDMSCSGQDPGIVSQMYNESIRMLNEGLSDLSQLYNDSITIPACTRMASQCIQTPHDPLHDHFDCVFPNHDPVSDAIDNSSFCSTSRSYASFILTCFGAPIVCFSDNEGQNASFHTCLYESDTLQVDCPLAQSDVIIDMYQSISILAQLRALCSNTAGCTLSHGIPTLLRYHPRQGTHHLLAQNGTPDSEEDPQEEEEDEPRQEEVPSATSVPANSSIILESHDLNEAVEHYTEPLAQAVSQKDIRTIKELVVEEKEARRRRYEYHLRMARANRLIPDPPGLLAKRQLKRLLSKASAPAHSSLLALPTLAPTHFHVSLPLANPTASNIVAAYAQEADSFQRSQSWLCGHLTENCSLSQLKCPLNDASNELSKWVSRDTFCTSGLPDSCLRHVCPLHPSPINTTSQSGTCHPLGYNLTTETYHIRCPASSVSGTYHPITCTYQSSGEPDCFYTCTANSLALQLHAYPVQASILLSQNLTILIGGVTGERIKCQHILAVAQQSINDPQNFFQCFPPYQTTATDVCYLNPVILDTYTHTCGELVIDCTRIPQTQSYNCTSRGYSECASTFSCSYTRPFLRVLNVSYDLVSTPLYSTCLTLREGAMNQSSYSCTVSGGTCYNSSNTDIYDCARADTLGVVCTPTFLPSGMPLTETLTCDSHAIICTFDVPSSFGFLSDGKPDFSTESTFDLSTLPYQEYTYSCSNRAEASSFLDLYCLGMSAYGLEIQHGYGYTPESERCLYIKDTCLIRDPGHSSFNCNCNYEQDSLLQQFCTAPILDPPITQVVTCGTYPTYSISCSNDPELTGDAFQVWMNCTLIQSVPSFSDGTSLLELAHCPIRVSEFQEAHQVDDSTVCELFRERCFSPLTCDSSIDCNCPVSLLTTGAAPETVAFAAATGNSSVLVQTSTVATCREPGQMCQGVFCQPDSSSVDPLSASLEFSPGVPMYSTLIQSPLRSVATCTFKPLEIHLTCASGSTGATSRAYNMTNQMRYRLGNASSALSSPPFVSYLVFPGPTLDVSASSVASQTFNTSFPFSYNVTCTRIDNASVTGGSDSISYRCVNSTALSVSGSRGLFMDCTVPLGAFRFADPSQVCARVGTLCVGVNGLYCASSDYVAIASEPYCSFNLAQASINQDRFYASNNGTVHHSNAFAGPGASFFCEDQLITCTSPPTGTLSLNRIQCKSDNSSLVWTLGGNRNPNVYPTVSGPGCTLGSPQVSLDFYKDPGQRCGVILSECFHTCIGGGMDDPMSANLTICQGFDSRLRHFKCDTQDIQCTLIQNTNSTLTIPLGDSDKYTSAASQYRYSRQLKCVHLDTAETVAHHSLSLDCIVNEYVMSKRSNDLCTALVEECRNNAGTFLCLGTYIATPEHPFCTQNVTTNSAQSTCACELWWSRSEGQSLVIRELHDVECPLDDPLNLYGGRIPGVSTSEPDGSGSAPTPCSTIRDALPEGMTCRRRGLLSLVDWMKWQESLGHGPAFTAEASRIFDKENQYYKRYWCLESYTRPRAVCAVRPGMYLPLCTVQCPPGLYATTLQGSRTRYCCRDPNHCTLANDARNCVLGRHDALCDENPWASCTQTQSNETLALPACPSNLFNEYTIYPQLVTQIARQPADVYAQPRYLCSHSPHCHGFVVFTDISSHTAGFFFSIRPIQFEYTLDPDLTDEYAVTEILVNSNVARRHDLDVESRYHLHQVPSSFAVRDSARVRRIQPFQFTADVFLLERNYGFPCTDTRLDWTFYLLKNTAARQRVNQRVAHHLSSLGADPALVQAMTWSAASQDLIRLDNRHDLFVVDPDTSAVTFPYRKFLSIDLRRELLADIAQGALLNSTLGGGLNLALNLSLHLPMAGFGAPSISQLLNVWLPSTDLAVRAALDTNLSRLLHPQFLTLRWTIPRFQDSQGNNEPASTTTTMDDFTTLDSNTGTGGQDPNFVYLSNYVDLPPTTIRIYAGRFRQLIAYFAWRDWIVFGTRTRGVNRANINSYCVWNTPLWFEGNAGPGLPYCSVNRCPFAPIATWSWTPSKQLIQESPQVVWDVHALYPNPPESALPIDRIRNIPCNNDMGWCGLDGTCQCYPFSNVKTPMTKNVIQNNQIQTPRVLKIQACQLDVRGPCLNGDRGINNVCSAHGECVGSFIGNKQSASCECGRFPIDPLVAFPPNTRCDAVRPTPTCNRRDPPLKWEENGWVADSTGGSSFCNIPAPGCRNPGAYVQRPTQGYQLGNSYSCVLPRLQNGTGLQFGRCITNGSLDQYGEKVWTCLCDDGHYGSQCEYPTLNGGCFDLDLDKFLVSSQNVRSLRTQCVWNAHLTQFEPVSYSNMPIEFMIGQVPIVCGGIKCSGHGQCIHEHMDQPNLEKLSPSGQDAFYQYIGSFPTPSEVNFTNVVKQRLLAQHCVCDKGWTGRYCNISVCDPPCVHGECTTKYVDKLKISYCKCFVSPQSGLPLATGPTCNDAICAGRGTIAQYTTVDQSTYRYCNCTAPYFQGADNTKVCNLYCDGRLQRLNTNTLTPIPAYRCICVNPQTHRETLCNGVDVTVS